MLFKLSTCHLLPFFFLCPHCFLSKHGINCQYTRSTLSAVSRNVYHINLILVMPECVLMCVLWGAAHQIISRQCHSCKKKKKKNSTALLDDFSIMSIRLDARKGIRYNTFVNKNSRKKRRNSQKSQTCKCVLLRNDDTQELLSFSHPSNQKYLIMLKQFSLLTSSTVQR